MASGSLRRYDVQAKLSVVLSAVAAVGALALAVVLLRNFDRELMVIPFGAKSLYKPVVMVIAAGTMFLAFVGVILGFNSAGQRRNEKQGQSWLGFFLGAAALCCAIVLFAMFWMYQLSLKT